MNRIIQLVDSANDWLARLLGWALIAMVLTTCVLVLLRYLANAGNLVFLQELIIYLHATSFMLGAAWVLKCDNHVRVDVFYRRASARRKAWVNALGNLVFLMPLAVFLLLSSHSFVARSWQFMEASPEPGGIPAVFLLKSLIPAMALLLLLQGAVELARSALTLIDAASEHEDG